jgi:poly(hydroxyalkanoate) depolymerase family esterase
MRQFKHTLFALLLVIAAVTVAVPATSGAATLPGMPAWSGTSPWWTKLPGLGQAGWSPPVNGAPQPPPPPAPPTGGGGTPPPAGGEAITPGKGASFSGTYTSSAGTRDYTGYVPSSYKPGTPIPLVVVLHGCTQSANVIRQLSRFDQLAEAKRFIAVFPQQPSSANYQSCWNFFQDAQTHRDSGEPALIAGITDWVQQHYTVDAKRTYVAGLSAGGAMASVMGATYPDKYAAIGVGSGCEYAATATCAGYKSADPTTAAQAAFKAMGSYARPMPVIAFQGDKDTTVPPVNADQLVQAEQVANDWADDGAENGSIPRAQSSWNFGRAPGGRTYTVKHYTDGHSHELAQYWVVNGMGHAWSGGNPAAQYADPAGPDESAAMYAFFMAHPAP